MNFFRKFYDVAITEPATQTIEETPSIAELMAKHGVNNSSADFIAPPIETSLEKKEETKEVKEEAPVATTNDPAKTELVKSESPAKEETKKEELADTAPKKSDEPQQKVQQWQEVLKSQQPDTVLKELGFDENEVSILNELKGFDKKEYFINFLKALKSGEEVTYLKELTTDYLKMPPEEVLRQQLRDEFPKATEAQLNVLYKNEVVKKYNLDSDDENEVEEGELLLAAKADKYRDTLIDRQKDKLAPKYQPKAAEPDPHEEAVKREQNRIRQEIEENPYTKSILSTKEIVIGEGEDSIKISIDDPESIVDLVVNGEPLGDYSFKKELNPDGSIKSLNPKVEHQILVQTVNRYGIEFINELFKKAKALGGAKAIKPIENAKPLEEGKASPSEISPKTPAEAMAKTGRYDSGGI